MAMPYLLPAVVMGFVAVGVLIAVGAGRRWHRYAPDVGAAAETSAGGAGRRALYDRPIVWVLAFLLLVGGTVGGVYLFLVAGAPGSLLSAPVYAVAGLAVAAFLVLGTIVTGRDAGHPRSMIFGEVVALFMGFLLLGVAALLLT